MSHTYSPTLWDHQMEAIAKALPVLKEHGGFYLAHDVGTGKTLTAMTLAKLLHAPTVLVICDKNAVAVWARHERQWWSGQDPLNASVMIVINYEQLVQTTYTRPDGTVVKSHGDERLKFYLKAMKSTLTLLILDESQKAKGPTSKISRAAWKLEQAATWKLRMSGSPQHSMLDLWAQYRYLVPHVPMFQMPYRDYKDGLVVLGGPNGNWIVDRKPDGEAAVAAAIEPYTHAVDAAVLNLPEPVYNVVPFKLSESEAGAYVDMEKELAIEFSDGSYAEASIILAKTLRLQQITSGFVPTNEEKTRILGSSKLDTVIDLIERRPRRKIIVGYRFTYEGDRLSEGLTKIGRPHFRLDGKVSTKDRGLIEDVFQTNDRPWILLIQEQTATSMTLTAASTVIPFSITPRVIDWVQFMGRAHRAGQTKYLEILVPCAEDTIDEEIYSGVRQKADAANMARILRDAVLRMSGRVS